MYTIFFGSNEDTTKCCAVSNYVNACEVFEVLCTYYLYVQLVSAKTGVCRTWKDPKVNM